jgi:hypothetical protein
MESFFFSVLPLLLMLLLLPFVVAPIFIRFQSAHPATPEFEPTGVDQLPPDIAESFKRFIHTMGADGFTFVGYFRQLAYMRGVGFHLALMKNPATGELVYIAEMFANKNLAKIRHSQIEFCSEFSDGFEITTNNSQQPRIHKASPEMKLFTFPEVNNPRVLYQLHRRLCASLASGTDPVFPADGTEAFILSYGTVKDVRKQAEYGYYFLDEKGKVFRPTWKGAYLMTWKLAWPVGPLLKASARKRARATMKSLGLAA